jgi:hypothetical protein
MIESEQILAAIQARLDALGIWSRSAEHETYMHGSSAVNMHWRYEQQNVRGSISYQEYDGTPTLWLRCWGRSYLADGTELPGTEVHQSYDFATGIWGGWEYEHD